MELFLGKNEVIRIVGENGMVIGKARDHCHLSVSRTKHLLRWYVGPFSHTTDSPSNTKAIYRVLKTRHHICTSPEDRIAHSLTFFCHGSAGRSVQWRQTNPWWTRCCNSETSRHMWTVSCDGQNIRLSRGEIYVETKPSNTAATVIIKHDQILKGIGWMEWRTVEVTKRVHRTVAWESVNTTCWDVHLNRLIVVPSCSSIRSTEDWGWRREIADVGR